MNVMLIGTFFMSGLSLGAIYALSGVGLVMLYKTSGVLNFAYGAIGALAAFTCWQVIEWGLPDPIGWVAALATGAAVALAYGRLIAPLVAYREPVVKAVATLGMAVGTGNIWRFPRIAASNGGGSFLVAWVVFLFLWSVPLMIVEFSFGKRARRGAVGSFVRMGGPGMAWMGGFIALCATAIMFC